MKKLFFMFVAAGLLMACNNAADATAEAKDSVDSVANQKKEEIDSAAQERKEKVDSLAEEKKEAIDRRDSLNRNEDTVNKK